MANDNDQEQGIDAVPSGGGAPASNGVKVLRKFQLVCVCHFGPKEPENWTFGTAVDITGVLLGLFGEINKDANPHFDYDVLWVLPGFQLNQVMPSLDPPAFQPWDVLMHFVLNPERSYIRFVTKSKPPGDPAGATSSSTPKFGAMCEVYLENNFPAAKLAKIAMHELMHLKLDIGPETQVVLDIHDLNKKNPLHGISDPASNESAVLTGSEKTLMADHLFDQVAIYKG